MEDNGYGAGQQTEECVMRNSWSFRLKLRSNTDFASTLDMTGHNTNRTSRSKNPSLCLTAYNIMTEANAMTIWIGDGVKKYLQTPSKKDLQVCRFGEYFLVVIHILWRRPLTIFETKGH